MIDPTLHIAIASEAEIPRDAPRPHERSGEPAQQPSLAQPHHYLSMLTTDGRGWFAKIEDRIVGFAVADLRNSNVSALFVEPGFEGYGSVRALALEPSVSTKGPLAAGRA